MKINVLDAPGTADFIGDVRSAIRAADAVIVVVSAVDGVEVQTEYAWELAVEEGLPRAIFVNKLDRERADFQGDARPAGVVLRQPGRARSSCRSGTSTSSAAIADLLHEKADLYPDGPKAEESEWPDEIHAMADPAREKLDRGGGGVRRRADRGVPRAGHAARGAHRVAARRTGSRPRGSRP